MVFDKTKDIKRAVNNSGGRREETVLDNINDDVLKKLEAIRRS